MRNLFLIIVSLLLSLVKLGAQTTIQLTDWKIYTSTLNSSDACFDDAGAIWSVTSGGAYKFNPKNNEYTAYGIIEGLITVDFRCIAFNPINKNVYLGALDGTIEIIDPTGKISHITDIREQKYPNPTVYKIVIKDSLAYIAGGFGIAIFNLNQKVFAGSVEKIGDFKKNTPVKDLIVNDNRIWAVTYLGAAEAKLSDQLSSPDSWQMFAFSGTAPTYQSIAQVNGNIYVSADAKLFQIIDDSLNLIKTFDSNIIRMVPKENTLYIQQINKIVDCFTGSILFEKEIISFITYDATHVSTVIGAANSGIYYSTLVTGFKHFLPNTPYSNSFASIDVSESGRIWSVSGEKQSPSAGTGIITYDGETWQVFNKDNNTEISSNKFFRTKAISGERIIFGNFGDGIIEANIINEKIVLKKYNQTNAAFDPVNGFVLVGGIDVDKSGTVWMANWANSGSGDMFVSWDKNGAFRSYPNCARPDNRMIMYMCVDPYGTKWVSSEPGIDNGFYYFNERGTPDNSADDACGTISPSTNAALAGYSANAMYTDKKGKVWIGTANGLSVIVNPSAVLASKSSLIVRNVKALNGIKINNIIEDAVGNMWFATGSGVWIMNSDGTELIQQITPDNSNLPTLEVLGIAYNKFDGRMYFGTKKGLASAVTPFLAPKQDYDINVFPQPFDLSKETNLTIEGLTAGTDMKIIATDGELVKAILTSSGKYIWDGKNQDGTYVKSGIYLIVTSSQETGTSSAAKIAVINK